MSEVNHIEVCEVCGNTELKKVLDLGNHPMCDDLVPFDNEYKCSEYPISIGYCSKCKTAHQLVQVPQKQLFPKTYHYRSRFTADVLKGMENLVSNTSSLVGGLEGKKVLDVGCNDGSLLDRFKKKGAITFGVEPTGAAKDADGREHIVYNDFFNMAVAEKIKSDVGVVDIVTFTNVFAHIEDLKGLINALGVVSGENTIFVIENHYLGAVFDKNQFDTFYHEHPRTYSFSSFLYIAEALGRKVVSVEFPKRYGGNIRVVIGNESGLEPSDLKNILAEEELFEEKFSAMNISIVEWKTKTQNDIAHLVEKYGKIPAKAFPGRAAILIKLLGLNETQIEAVYEKPGSMKIGNYIPGTRIEIRSESEFFERMDEYPVMLNFAWHISSEIREYLKINNYDGQVIDIL